MPDLFGVAVSPYELQEWMDATAIRPDLCMIFEAWSRQRSLKDVLAKAASFGHTKIVITWEPWEPTALGLPAWQQAAIQPRWTNASIVNGDHDDYIDMIARDMRDSGLDVYLRWGHEMNGVWYPWSADSVAYVEAWKYLRKRIRSVRNAWNVSMMWAPNPDLWRKVPADWLRKLLPYWPGHDAVDHLGFTMIERGVEGQDYTVADFAERADLARLLFQRPLIAAEVNVVHDMAVNWLTSMAGYITDSHPEGTPGPYPVFVLSQGPSRAEAAGNAGDLSWSAIDYVAGRNAIRLLANAQR